MTEYKGYGGGKITIDGDNIFIKQMFIKENCTFEDIISVTWNEPTALKNGNISIKTKKQNIVPHSIIFLKKDREMFEELYTFLLEKAPQANPIEVVKSTMLDGDIEDAVNVIRTMGYTYDVHEYTKIYNNDKLKAREYLRKIIKDAGNKESVANINFCPECGSKVEGMKFCPECGNQIGQSPASITQPQAIYTPAPDYAARCPKCGSTSLSADKKGFGIGKAVVGAALTGGIGLAAGNIGSKKVRVTCLGCGHQWMAGKE